MTQVADDVLHHHDGPVDDHAEVEGAQGKQVCRDMPQVETDRREEEREGDGEGHDEGPRNSREKRVADRHEDEALGEVVEDRVRRMVDQVAPVVEGDHLHARGQDVLVQLFHLFVEAIDGRIEIGAFPHEHDAETTSSLSMILPSARWIALPNRPSRIFGPCATAAMSLTLTGVPFFAVITVSSISPGANQPDGAHVDLLHACLDKASARVHVVVGELLLHLAYVKP